MGTFGRAISCLRDGRVPYRVWHTATSPASARFHRPTLDGLLRLGKSREPRTLDFSSAVRLHDRYPPRDGYKYDAASKLQRAANYWVGLTRLLNVTEVRDIV